jgi:heme-degrading monooxygenase HmoA
MPALATAGLIDRTDKLHCSPLVEAYRRAGADNPKEGVMFVRLITVRGATRIDEAVDFIRDTILPEVRQQKGFSSINLSGDRSAGLFSVLTVWETEADRDSSEGFSEKARNQALEILGGELTVNHFEQVLWETGPTPPAPGAKLHARQFKMDPARVDENLESFKQTVLPDIKATPGFLSVRQLINRQTGEGVVGTVWADEPSLQTAIQKAEQRRPQAASQGVELGDGAIAEVLFRAT